MFTRLFLTLSMVMWLGGCATHYVTPDSSQGLLPYAQEDSVDAHLFFIDGQGQLRDSEDNVVEDINSYIDAMMRAYDHYATHDANLTLMLYIHGGLDERADIYKRAQESYRLVLEDGIFPVFIGWESGFAPNIANHFFATSTTQSYPSLSMWRFLEQSTLGVLGLLWQTPAYYANSLDTSTWGKPQNITLSPSSLALYASTQNTFSYDAPRALALVNPTKLITVPFVHHYGKAVWEELYAQTQRLFLPTSPLYALMPRLEGKPLMLGGTSMGSLVGNGILEHFDSVTFDTIFYTGAACATYDIGAITLPYVARHPETQLYMVSLHEANDAHAQSGAGFIEGGSLLEWVDDMFATVGAPPRAGLWRHIVPYIDSLTIAPELAARVHLSRIDVDTDTSTQGPQAHETLYHYRYWRSDYWSGVKYERIYR
ncbi:MAG: hypothetical protein KU28_01855 [Sulfurovum sp. PC08-66]|nr:MAG: hypothetical protein KU28_01855 [Sulfurovum sp. PC08-66]KIM12676.1 MAG: hypothetical protein KU37_01960 [Sulfuricurvum sp. PC08-66]